MATFCSSILFTLPYFLKNILTIIVLVYEIFISFSYRVIEKDLQILTALLYFRHFTLCFSEVNNNLYS